MNRTEALKLLRLNGDGDGRAIEQSYWSLVRRAQSRSEDPRSQKEIERLNEAYALLAPAAEPQAVTASRAIARPSRPSSNPAPAAPGFFFPDEVLAWFGCEAARVRQRWTGRNVEIALISGAALVVIIAALAAGASIPLVFASAVVIGAGVWAPWRRVDDGEG